MFKKEIYSARRRELKKQFTSGVLLFLGNDESSMNYLDNTYRYRQDSSFLYYFGLSHAGLTGVIDIDNDKEYIFGDDLTIDDMVWMGAQPSLAERALGADITDTASLAKLESYLATQKKSGRDIHFLPAYRPEHNIKLYNLLKVDINSATQQASTQLIIAVAEQRNVKSAEEIAEIEKAVSITSDMHRAAMNYARPGMSEAQVAAKVNEVAQAAGGELSFPTIATINGQTLHNHCHSNIINEGDIFLLDAGAEIESGYAGDMSSAFPVAPRFNDEQKVIYQIALDAHEAAIAMLRPGTHYRDVHFAAARTIFDGLKDIGLVKGDTHAAVEAGAHALFFPCGTGHMMGLDIHDMENLGEKYVGYAGHEKSTLFGLKSLRLSRELQAGYVLTIEPGIYFIPELIELWKSQNKFSEFINYAKVEEYKDFGGVRNEEDFLITPEGYRLLGKPLAKRVEDVEAERAKAF